MARLWTLIALVAMLAIPSSAQAKKVSWKATGASVFGGHCEAGWQGYRGADLRIHWKSFAELNMGTAMGNLPNKTKIRVLDPRTHRKMTIRKRDIGRGGGHVKGHRRSIDLWYPVARKLSNAGCNWTGVVLWRRIK